MCMGGEGRVIELLHGGADSAHTHSCPRKGLAQGMSARPCCPSGSWLGGHCPLWGHFSGHSKCQGALPALQGDGMGVLQGMAPHQPWILQQERAWTVPRAWTWTWTGDFGQGTWVSLLRAKQVHEASCATSTALVAQTTTGRTDTPLLRGQRGGNPSWLLLNDGKFHPQPAELFSDCRHHDEMYVRQPCSYHTVLHLHSPFLAGLLWKGWFQLLSSHHILN